MGRNGTQECHISELPHILDLFICFINNSGTLVMPKGSLLKKNHMVLWWWESLANGICQNHYLAPATVSTSCFGYTWYGFSNDARRLQLEIFHKAIARSMKRMWLCIILESSTHPLKCPKPRKCWILHINCSAVMAGKPKRLCLKLCTTKISWYSC